MENTQDRAEHRRQLYVSLTRVKDLLIIVGAPKSHNEWKWGYCNSIQGFWYQKPWSDVVAIDLDAFTQVGEMSQISSLTHRHYTNMMHLWMPN